jgi:hypothetical protein
VCEQVELDAERFTSCASVFVTHRKQTNKVGVIARKSSAVTFSKIGQPIWRSRASTRSAARRAERSTIDALEQELELAATHRHARSTGGDRDWDPVHSTIETFVENAVTGAVEPQDLGVCPTTIVKNERGLSTRVAAQFGAHDPRQPIE